MDAQIAGVQSFAIMGANSTLGARSGYSSFVEKMLDAGLAACGLPT